LPVRWRSLSPITALPGMKRPRSTTTTPPRAATRIRRSPMSQCLKTFPLRKRPITRRRN